MSAHTPARPKFWPPNLIPENLDVVAYFGAIERDEGLSEAEAYFDRELARAKAAYDRAVGDAIERKRVARDKAFSRFESLQAGCEPGAHDRFMAAAKSLLAKAQGRS